MATNRDRAEQGNDPFETADQISAALAQLPTSPGITYRGLTDSGEHRAVYDPGQILTEHGFTSTTRDPAIALAGSSDDTLLVVVGRSGVEVRELGEDDPDAEVIIDKGARFKVLSAEWLEALQLWVICVREVTKPPLEAGREPLTEADRKAHQRAIDRLTQDIDAARSRALPQGCMPDKFADPLGLLDNGEPQEPLTSQEAAHNRTVRERAGQPDVF